MGAEFQIDVDVLRMFRGYDWWDFGELCDHDCDHLSTSVVGWGPTTATYELYECDGRDGCGCRSWLDGRYYTGRHHGTGRFWWEETREWHKQLRSR